MSHYMKVNAKFTHARALVAALLAVGFEQQHIVQSDEAVALNNYNGVKTENLAHVRIPRQHIGPLCNDFGVNTETGEVFICDYAKTRSNVPAIREKFGGHGANFINRLTQEYQYTQTVETYALQGQYVERVDTPDGSIKAYVSC